MIALKKKKREVENVDFSEGIENGVRPATPRTRPRFDFIISWKDPCLLVRAP